MKTAILTSAFVPILLLQHTIAPAQSAAKREDARLREEQLLRANEQLSLLLERLEKAEAQIAELDSRLKATQSAQQSADARIAQLDTRISREKEALLDEVANIIAEYSPRTSSNPTTLRQPAPGGARPASANAPPTATQPPREIAMEYVVKRGDTLSSISRNLSAQGLRISAAEIAAANNITDVTKIRVGQKLLIPKK